MRRKIWKYIAAVPGVVLVIPFAVAHDHAIGVVKERMEMMEAMAKRVKAIGNQIKNKQDIAIIKREAVALQALTPHLVHLFPPGSTQPPTDASAAIWKNWPDFEAKAKALEGVSARLADASEANIAELTGRFRAVSQSCGGCHELYRVKR